MLNKAPASSRGFFEILTMQNHDNKQFLHSENGLIRRRTWAEIDLEAAKYNFEQIRNRVGQHKICCVIKANAYGHGAVMLGRLYEKCGASFFAVSNIEEALQLRLGGIQKPILILGYSPAECARIISKNNISQAVFSEEYASQLANEARKAGVNVKIHIKVDTGMGRIGFISKDEKRTQLEQIINACLQGSLIPEGIFTHFSSADMANGQEETERQLDRFLWIIEQLKKRGIGPLICHCANSAAGLALPESRLDMVRAGIILYGMPPSDEFEMPISLKPVMRMKSVISHIKEIQKGDTISYGQTFVAKDNMIVATIPIGYADGLSRAAGNGNYSICVGGQEAVILGRVCMDQMMVDVTGILCHVGDEVEIFGSQPGHTANDLAKRLNTISYEVLCDVGARVPRFYYEEQKCIACHDTVFSQDLSCDREKEREGGTE